MNLNVKFISIIFVAYRLINTYFNMKEKETDESTVIATPTKKEIFFANLRKKYPERSFEDEDEFYGASMEGYDTEHEFRKTSESSNKEFFDKLQENPDVALFIGSILNKESFGKALSYLSDVLPFEEGSEDFKAYNESVAERQRKAAEGEAAAAEYESNLQESANVLQEFADENGMTPDEAMEFVQNITTTISDKLFSGKIDKEFLDAFYKVQNYEKDLMVAKEAGIIQGRNEKIDAKKKALMKGDGLPPIRSSASTAPEAMDENPTLAALSQMSKKAERNAKLF